MIRRVAACVLASGVVLLSLSAFTRAEAQNKGSSPHHHHQAPKSRAGDAGAASESVSLPVHGEPEGRAIDAGAIESKTLDGGTRVFRFGEVEIEGRLRNPQLVYFLRRVRAEFAAGELGHRTFMRELSDTRHDPSF